MPEENGTRKHMRAIDKCVSDPKQFLIGLLGESFSRVNSRVYKQEWIHPIVAFQPRKKSQVLGGNYREDLMRRRPACRDPVTFKGRFSTVNQEHVAVLAIKTEVRQEHVLMVAL